MDDNELLALINSRPSEGLSIAVDQYGGMVKSAVVLILGNGHPDVEDCVADAFIKLWRHSKKVSAASFRSYLYTLARNTAIDVLRKDGKKRVVQLDDSMCSTEPSIEDAYIDTVNQKLTAICVNELPEPDKTIFLRRYYHGDRVKEIADDLGVKPKLVENTLYRRKKQMEQKLIKMGVQI